MRKASIVAAVLVAEIALSAGAGVLAPSVLRPRTVVAVAPAVAAPTAEPSVPWARFAAMRHLAYVRRQRARHLAATLRRPPSVREAVGLACTTFRVSCARVWWIAVCESSHPGGVPDPGAANPSGAAGMGQFIPSTWASTPYRGFSVYSAYAAALAIAWEVKRGGSYVHWWESRSCWAPRS